MLLGVELFCWTRLEKLAVCYVVAGIYYSVWNILLSTSSLFAVVFFYVTVIDPVPSLSLNVDFVPHAHYRSIGFLITEGQTKLCWFVERKQFACRNSFKATSIESEPIELWVLLRT